MNPAIYLLIGLVCGVVPCLITFWLLKSKKGEAGAFGGLESSLSEKFNRANADMAARVEQLKGDLRTDLGDRVQQGLSSVRDTVEKQLTQGRDEQATRLNQTATGLDQKLQEVKAATETKLNALTDKQTEALKDSRTELTNAFKSLSDRSENKLEELKKTVEGKLSQIQTDNSNQLEAMRRTVDEKLQGTLDKRLGESFKQVSERLELVHKGLGEMQSLANGVGDLKKVLTNVKVRGTWGEMQLGNLLEQIMAPGQYVKNFPTRPGSTERVEFAIKFPGRDENGAPIFLPIDAKFPKEDYEQLVKASEEADIAGLELAGAKLEARVKAEAKNIRDKYIEPPATTDFAVLYLPVEGLYAEVLRRPGLVETLQRTYRVTVAGPTVLAALLNSLHMGFTTLEIEKHSSEVWKLLASIKTEFGNFGEVIGKVQKKLQEASNVIETAATRSRVIEKKLRDVHAPPSSEPQGLTSEAEILPLEDAVGK